MDPASRSTTMIVVPTGGALLAAGAVVTSAAVLLVDASLLDRIGDSGDMPDHFVMVATDEAAEAALGRRVEISLAA
jgi:hypothetical protein